MDPFLPQHHCGTGNLRAYHHLPASVPDSIITYVTNVTSSQQQIIQIEYTIRRDMSLIALRDQNGTFGIDVVFKKRFR